MAGPLQGAGSAQQLQQPLIQQRANEFGGVQQNDQQESKANSNVRTERSSSAAETQNAGTENQGNSSQSSRVGENNFESLVQSDRGVRGGNVDILV